MPIIIALDQGTTNAKALAIDHTGAVLATATRPVAIANGGGGRVEQDPQELWEASRECVARCLASVPLADVAGIAVTNQRETVVAWDRVTGAPIGPALSWQDTRTAATCASVSESDAARVKAITGLTLDPMFSAPKARWLLDSSPADVLVGTVDTWLVWCLTGGDAHVTEPGNASRTLLLSLDTRRWDEWLDQLFGVPIATLPKVVPSTGPFGVTRCDGVPDGLPILAVLADSHAALRGHAGNRTDVVKATYGTGSSVMRSTGAHVARADGVSTTIAWDDGTATYALEGNIRYSGAALEWAANVLGVADAAALGVLAGSTDDAGSVTLVPAFGGLGAPYWDPDAVGIISGLTASSTRAQVARAAFDAVAMQVADVVEAIAERGEPPVELRCDGGATASALLMQIQADALGCDVVVVGDADIALRGVAGLAFSTLGIDLPPAVSAAVYRPAASADQRAQRRRSWAREVDRSRR